LEIAIYIEVDDATNLDKLLPVMARQCAYLDEALAGHAISAESYIQSVVLSDGTVLLD